MKNIKRILLLIVCFTVILGCMPANAIIPYSTYTYDIDGQYMESPHAYVPYEVIDQEFLGVSLTDPTDFCVDFEKNIYISDKGTSGGSVLILDEHFKVIGRIDKYTNEWGVPEQIVSPAAVFVTPTRAEDYLEGDDALNKKTLYVCDSTQNRILVFDVTNVDPELTVEENASNIAFETTIRQPESDVFAEGHIFRPVAVAVDKVGRVYSVGELTHQGIISMNNDGSFFGFLGAQTQETSFVDIIWRAFQTEEQRRNSVKTVSTEYNNINIDGDGFVYATTSTIPSEQQMQAITSKDKSGTYAPVKKLSPNGDDVMKRNGFYPPSGEVTVAEIVTDKEIPHGASVITDVALGPNGTWSIIDENRSRVFTYDEEGRLLYAFGDKGNQLGNIKKLAAIEYHGNNLLLLDSENKNITVFKRTSYGDALNDAIVANIERRYTDAEKLWQDILQLNSNFDMSYIGIGKSLYREASTLSDDDPRKVELFKEAMLNYEYAYDTANWSDCFQDLRKIWIKKYIILIPIVVIAVCILMSKFMKVVGKTNKKEEVVKKNRTLWSEFCYGFHVMFHPFDGFYDIKHEYRASVKGALLIFAFTVVAFIYQSIGQGYVMNPVPGDVSIIMSVASIALPVVLWTVANWCLTTLFDGEGSIRDIFIATCYSLFPLPAIIILTTLYSNFITASEIGFVTLFIGLGYFWVGFLLFFGMMTIHDYSLLKNVLTCIASIVGMAIIMFLGVLFSSLIGKIFSFIYNIVLELSYRT
ncbi:MAG: YIP1 family protein [Clostridia bacterium]|nr:YIP1 family protein [Clostridia bacterium]